MLPVMASYALVHVVLEPVFHPCQAHFTLKQHLVTLSPKYSLSFMCQILHRKCNWKKHIVSNAAKCNKPRHKLCQNLTLVMNHSIIILTSHDVMMKYFPKNVSF